MESPAPVFKKFYTLTNWILDRLERYPRSVRIILADRMGALCMDILEMIVRALYTRERLELLKELNVQLELLRIQVRMSKDRQYINVNQYEYCTREINEVGAMIGGWIKSQGQGHEKL